MKSFLSYYAELHDRPAKEFARWSLLGESNWKRFITEGLITSYPKEDVGEFLSREFPDSKINIDNDYIILVSPHVVIEKDVNLKLNVYGWHIAKVDMELGEGFECVYNVIIEPKQSKEIEISTDGKFYHLTHKKHLKKIFKNGLVAKESSTTFFHPPERVYLLYSNNLDAMKKFAVQLAHDKNESKPSNDPNLTWNKNTIVFLEIVLPPGVTLYSDPMFHHDDIAAVFVKQSIHPQYIKVSDELSYERL